MGRMKEIFIEDFERDYLRDQIYLDFNEYYFEDEIYKQIKVGKTQVRRLKINRHYGKIKSFGKGNKNIIY